MNDEIHEKYYVPPHSYWPALGCVALLLMAFGVGRWLHEQPYWQLLSGTGFTILLLMMWGWFKDVINESLSGLYSKQMDRTFRLGMLWFIFSEVCFFAAFFGAFFYARYYIVPFLGGEDGHNPATHKYLYDTFEATWPLLVPPNPDKYTVPHHAMGAIGLPLINTLLLLTSGATLTVAHWAIAKHQQSRVVKFLFLTVLLGAIFLGLQAYEYHHAMHDLKLTLNSGIYGSTFYLLTGFHGLHVTIGAIMLTVVMFRTMKGHFQGENHFAFEAVAWYWHFVDVVWLFLFFFVYLL